MTYSITRTILFAIFAISIAPLFISTETSGISINYFYCSIFFLPTTKVRNSKSLILLLIVYSLIFVAGFWGFLQNDSFYFTRTLASFIIFILPFLFGFIKIEDAHFETFKKAIVLVSIIYSVLSIFQLLTIGYSGDFYATKAIIGSQRFGFVIILSFFIVMYGNSSQLKKIGYLLILLCGIILTFSRASFVAFGLTGVFFIIRNIKNIKINYVINASLLGLLVLFIFRDTIIGEIVSFFSKYLSSYQDYNLGDRATSEGYRVYVFKQIFHYVLEHPLFGSNFAGLYLLFEEYSGVGASAHGQYNDVLLRTGMVGFILYIYVLYRMAKYYASCDQGIFYGFISILIYGLFHETFKLGHGGFIFAILLAYYLSKRESSAVPKVDARRLN